MVRIRDVARVELGANSSDRYSRFNGAPTAAIGIYQSPGANAVDVTKAVRETMDDARQALPQRSRLSVFFDTTVFVTSTIEEVIRTLLEAFVLVGIVVFLFLGKLRTTLIPLIAVPVSIIGAFAGLLAVGYSANTVSLLALVLAIGIVVDDAIVVIENVERVVEEEPELTDSRGDQEGDVARSPRRSSPSRWCCCRCSCRSRSFPASAGSCSGSSPSRCRSRC